jgi:hypothetical protein
MLVPAYMASCPGKPQSSDTPNVSEKNMNIEIRLKEQTNKAKNKASKIKTYFLQKISNSRYS